MQYAIGATPAKNNMTFIEWADKWVKTYKENNIKSSTYSIKYKSFLESHLTPYFKNIKISNISQIDIQKFINTKSDFTKETQKRYVNILKAIFESAIENNIIYKNPVKNIVIKSGATKKEKRVYSQKEVDTIIEFAKTHKYGAAIIVFLKTGLRRGELLGLKFDDIDFENNIINVKGSVSDVPVNGKLTTVYEEDSNDTKNHKRQIPFKPEVREALLTVEKKSEFVFPNSKGEINSPNNYSHIQYSSFMNDLLEKYPEIIILNAHELRHNTEHCYMKAESI